MGLKIVIPGTPVAQGRPKAARTAGGHVQVYDPKKSRNWKATAQVHMIKGRELELGTYDPFEEPCDTQVLFPSGPLELRIVAYWPPVNPPLKRNPRPCSWRAKRPDADNVAKAVMDAGDGILWTDDSQVARLLVEKFHAAQGEGARVEIEVEEVP